MTATYGPYSPVRKVGNLLFLSGHIGIDPTNKTAAKDIDSQTKQIIANLASTLKDEGATLKNIIKTTVFLVNMEDFAAMNAIYEKLFTPPRPARSTVAVRELPRVAGDTQILVEIEAIAYLEQL